MNPHRIPTLKGRLDVLCNLLLAPVTICLMLFTRPVLYRLFGVGLHFVDILNNRKWDVVIAQCKGYGWINQATLKVTCEHRPLDVHAILAMVWIGVFGFQLVTIKLNFRRFHKMAGQAGFALASMNTLGSLFLVMHLALYPIETASNKPLLFAPFMWFVAMDMLFCLKRGYDAIGKHDIDEHSLWLYRAFMGSFTTPVLRFYPLVVRYIFGTECVRLNKPRLLIGAVFVGLSFLFGATYVANRKVLKEPFDGYLAVRLVVCLLGVVAESLFVKKHGGTFIQGVHECWKVGPDNYTLRDEL
mmetsp:Transcript_44614/g.94941  ORF Transcript_44614/g.94941 Transcript_44614/m.94941 type:complete len:300 (+) Transcript_44614:153-1052(+)|eukprot:CAMPEP_0172562322 /NCGR_PEP_ID=MMETSP1067-20121228/96470_1 /TAXON_ID=265564 ORGANISM="Thalassiosira punctigera, Strain Tpunct2005C2" /NCGR_SAMPLE_ID=MMETSP1067 /ASSEMBLY_ACC=CAM_ASM_000444 /LENGTH=299 /DNA_ID=CAMNT_0013352525 /DNA_START=68 /DNA_END=967 /DNA_ORIENTATION=-